MSARLTTAIRMGEAAEGILQKIRRFPALELHDIETPGEMVHVGVEPMLLALAMELALKAWFVFDFDDPHVAKSHDLLKLFDSLKPDSRANLEAQYKASVAPYHSNGLVINGGIRDILYQHKDAFVDWRYLHEAKKSMMFDQGAFEATLEMVLLEFKKRYRTERIKPLWQSWSYDY